MWALVIDREELDIEGFCTEGVEGRDGVGEGDGGVVTHILCAVVATSFATVCASVEYGLT